MGSDSQPLAVNDQSSGPGLDPVLPSRQFGSCPKALFGLFRNGLQNCSHYAFPQINKNALQNFQQQSIVAGLTPVVEVRY
jgi:hypothetical protein